MDLHPKQLVAAVLFALAEQQLGPAYRKRLRLRVNRVGQLEIVLL